MMHSKTPESLKHTGTESCRMCGGGQCVAMAKGGEASPEPEHHEEPEAHVEGDEGHDDDLHEMIGHEMMGAIHRKDHKALMHTVEAAVLNCLSKKGKE